MITPMVTKLIKDPFDREGWSFELKWDGFGAIGEIYVAHSVQLPPVIFPETAFPQSSRWAQRAVVD